MTSPVLTVRAGINSYEENIDMAFNKNTWSKDYTNALGIKMLGARDAVRKGFTPKYSKGTRKEGADKKEEGPS